MTKTEAEAEMGKSGCERCHTKKGWTWQEGEHDPLWQERWEEGLAWKTHIK
jgi:hypothetical protein